VSLLVDQLRDPYKGLAAFDAADALLFFGREQETEIVAANALASRLTVLYGPSGVGKSSLLRAGVVQDLRSLPPDDAVAVAYFSTWAGDAPAGLEAAARGALADACGGDPGDAPGDLVDHLDAWTSALGCELCLVLDQFEEVFLYDDGDRVVHLLPELVTRPGLRVNVVLGIRDDQLARLDVFKAQIPGLFSNYLRLDPLGRRAARAAILGPLEHYNRLAAEEDEVQIEPPLVEAILDEVSVDSIQGGGPVDAGQIEAPYLQLVLQRLWDVERERRSNVLRESTLVELGGARQIVETHLERAMSALSPAQQDVAALMFGHLVTPSGSKIAHGPSDLASFAKIDQSQLEPVLSSLASERILRPTGANGHAGNLYEIYHDVLAGAVLEWRARHESEAALTLERAASRRRQRKLATVAAVSFAALVAMAVLTVFAFTQRSSARHQAALARDRQAQAVLAAQRARIAQTDAERQKGIAQAQRERAKRQTRKAEAATAAEKQQAARAKAEATRADTNERIARANEAVAKQTASELRVQKQQAVANAALAVHQTGLAKRQKRAAELNLRRATAARKTAAAEAELQRAQAQLAVDPVAGVRAALASTTVRLPNTESVLRSALLAMNAQLDLPAAGPAAAGAFSPSGSRFALADRKGLVRVFRLPDGKLIATLRAGSPLNAVAFSPNDQLVAAGSKDGRVRVWDLTSPSLPLHTLEHGGPATGVAYSPDGKLLLTAGGDSAKLWDATSGVLLRTLPHPRTVLSGSFDADGHLVLTVAHDSAARVWNVATGELVTLPQRAQITGAAFGPDDLVVTGARDNTGAIWDGRTGALRATLIGHTSQVLSVAFSPAGDRVATGSADGTSRIWRLDGSLLDVERPERASVNAVAFSPDGATLVSASSDGSAITWGPAQRTQHLLGQTGPMRSAFFSPDGLTVATVSGSTARLWDPYGEPVLHGIHKSAHAATAVAFDPSGRLLASGDADGQVLIQRAHGGPIRTISLGSGAMALSWAHNGVLLAAAKDGTVRLLGAGGARVLLTLHHPSPLVSAALRSDGAVVATAGTDGVVRLWDGRTGRPLLRFVPPAPLGSIALDPTGRFLATANAKDVLVFDARTGARRAVLHGHTDTVTGLAFSPDGSRLVTSSVDHDAIVWNPRTAEPIMVLHRHTSFVSGVAFSADGRWIATAGPSKAGVWATRGSDLAGSFLYFVRGNQSPIAAVAFSRSDELATAARDGSIRVVDCHLCGGLASLEAYARRRLKRLSG
jgi:WD40 repeat protein/cytoskeletal protein RodZ